MKLIDKYIIREFMVPFVYCFMAFLLVFIIGDLFENLDNFIIQKVSWNLVCKYYFFLIPSIFVLTTPLAVLLSILYQLGYMSRYNELTALKANGISFLRIITPFFIIGIIFSILLFTISERLAPSCSKGVDRIRETYIDKKVIKDSENSGLALTEKNITFFSSLYNLSFYVSNMSKDEKTAQGVSIREFNKDGILKREWYGEKAVLVDKGWWLFNGYIRNYTDQGEIKGEVKFFKKQDTGINIPTQDLLRSQKDISIISSYMNIKELYNYIKRNFTLATLPRELLVDLYRKISIPFIMLLVTTFGIIYGGRISKGGALSSVGSSLGLYLVYYAVTSLFLAMGKLGKIMPSLAVWTPQILFGTISIYLLKRTK